MLTRNNIEAELAFAYLQAIAASESFAVDIPHIDADSIDAEVCGKGRLDDTSTKLSPKIQVQLKSSINTSINNDGNLAFSLSLKNYDDLRSDTVLPRLLVLLALPQSQVEWLIHHPDKLILQKCAYYLNLKGYPASPNQGSQTVYIPSKNMLSPDVLKQLMIKASKQEDL